MSAASTSCPASFVAHRGLKRKADEELLEGIKKRRFEYLQEIEEEKRKLEELAVIMEEDEEEEEWEIPDFTRSLCKTFYDHNYEDQEEEERRLEASNFKELLREMAERKEMEKLKREAEEDADYYSSLYEELFGDDDEEDGQELEMAEDEWAVDLVEEEFEEEKEEEHEVEEEDVDEDFIEEQFAEEQEGQWMEEEELEERYEEEDEEDQEIDIMN
ncbi:unnamed protein product [Bursaphelenchus xylophilus]|uniref:(pine wood nematode) hypothetical protein n=1 Tax=Bursaphelenchus xylophilus TaxID=6326 RepID=A0A1I7RJH1_BURXY|nr:unnamed protein product [Bursaphelenchus xylophilus]CAG9128881.1 unnamed protein product [Bursaphelenchus xylophilus]